MSQAQNTCSCCQMEKSDLRPYPDLGVMLCSYCELLPGSVIQGRQQDPTQDNIFTTLARLLGRMEGRVLQQDPSLPLRTPIHDKALALILQIGTAKMCSKCNNIGHCTCKTGVKNVDTMVEPPFWPYKEARDILDEVTLATGVKPQ